MTGRVPTPLHRFIAAWVRYTMHVMAFLSLVGGPFPGFVGAAGSYPVDLAIDPPARQRRVVTLFRGFLAVPALILGGRVHGGRLGRRTARVVDSALHRDACRRACATSERSGFATRGQANAYLFLLTDRYPYSAPAVRDCERDEQLVLPIDELVGIEPA